MPAAPAPGLPHRYVFVGGLHRSGTSFTARMLAALPGAGGIEAAPVPENEGVYLQGAIPHDALSGQPMHFATDPSQHMTEDHPANRLETKQRLEADWAPWFSEGVAWRVEKSPVNLTRTRLLQQLFPLSHFVLVMRHPEAVAASCARWLDSPAERLHAHWAEAHRRMEEDIRRLHHVLVIRYEDAVRAPERMQAALAAFLDTGTTTPPAAEPVRDGNAQYRGFAARITGDAAGAAARWGYLPGLETVPVDLPLRHSLRRVADATREALPEQAGAGRGRLA
ncbi:sulfotransferase family protein [Cribrihabitans neustonicus]|uniref:sulfotransferase family protein n=1 Tax=Cribrihabitans neustonicus TaxID=1429085 RepID=UPI003B596313